MSTKRLVLSIVILLCLLGILGVYHYANASKSGNTVLVEKSTEVLETYFNSLRTGNYERVAQFYCGSYEILAEYNPMLNRQDGAALFEAACKKNGFLCDLQIGSTRWIGQTEEGIFQFEVEFKDKDDNLYKFEIYDMSWQDGQFCVEELPPYHE